MKTDKPSPTLLWERISHNEDESRELGRQIGRACRGGEIILLEGPLGAGKTRLAGGIGEGLGIERAINSPTYLILRTYENPGALTLHHFDFYRLENDNDLDTIGVDDCLNDQSVIVAEWPSRCPRTFADFTLRLDIEVVGENARRIRMSSGNLLEAGKFVVLDESPESAS